MSAISDNAILVLFLNKEAVSVEEIAVLHLGAFALADGLHFTQALFAVNRPSCGGDFLAVDIDGFRCAAPFDVIHPIG